MQNQHSSLTENHKLLFYKNIFKFNQRPYYVDICRFKSDRSTICKYRISAHSLAIERGRYKNIPRDDRFCPKCTIFQVKDEIHFFLNMLNCPAYNIYRQEYSLKLKCSNTNFNSLTESKMYSLFNSNSLIVLKAIIEYINKCQEIL